MKAMLAHLKAFKRSIIYLLAAVLVLGLAWILPHSPFSVSIESGKQDPGVAQANNAPPTPVETQNLASLPPDATGATPAGPGDVYFLLRDADGAGRLARLPGECVTGKTPCPEPETVQAPFDLRDLFLTAPALMAWSPDAKYAALVTHPKDDLSKGSTPAELQALKSQSPDQFKVAASTVYLFDAETSAWRELYRLDRKYIYAPVWSANGQWLAFAVRSSPWAFHPNQADDGVYVIHPDGSGLKQLSSADGVVLGWVGSSVAIQRRTKPYPALDAAIELLSLNGGVTSLFTSARPALYQLSPDGGALLAIDSGSEDNVIPLKAADVLALDGSITHSLGSFDNRTGVALGFWSPDSTLAGISSLRRAYVSAAGGAPRQVYQANDAYVEPSIPYMQFSRDNQFLLLSVWDGIPKLVIVSLENDQARTVTWGGIKPEDFDFSGQTADYFSWQP